MLSSMLSVIMNLTFAFERLRSVLRRQHKALSTESTYIYWLWHNVSALRHMPDYPTPLPISVSV